MRLGGRVERYSSRLDVGGRLRHRLVDIQEPTAG